MLCTIDFKSVWFIVHTDYVLKLLSLINVFIRLVYSFYTLIFQTCRTYKRLHVGYSILVGLTRIRHEGSVNETVTTNIIRLNEQKTPSHC